VISRSGSSSGAGLIDRGLTGTLTDLGRGGRGEFGGESRSSRLESTIVLLTFVVFAAEFATDDDLCLCKDKFNDGRDAIDMNVLKGIK
jgi:hypothetical protein